MVGSSFARLDRRPTFARHLLARRFLGVTFDVAPQDYDRFMGRFSEPLASRFAELADLHPDTCALDVGCGPGALTAELVARLGPRAVWAIDPSASFVESLRHRLPQVDVRAGVAERLPFDDDRFDSVLAQLVVHFMADPVAGLAEMRRVARPGGIVAACVWDHSGGTGPLSMFWRAARDLDDTVVDESDLAGSRKGHLEELCERAGLTGVESCVLTVRVAFATFEDWWEPFTLGVGPAGGYVARLEEPDRSRLAAHCEELLPAAPFEVAASAWAVRARA